MSRDIKRAMADEVIARTKKILEQTDEVKRKHDAVNLLSVINEQKLIDRASYADVRSDLKDCFAALSAIAV